MNKLLLIGNLGRDPEMHTFPSGDLQATVNLGTSERWKDRSTGEWREATEWHRVIFKGHLANKIRKEAVKGTKLFVEGQSRTRQYNDKNGNPAYITEVHAYELHVLNGNRPRENAPDARQDSNGERQRSHAQQMPPQQGYDDEPGFDRNPF